MKIIGWKFGIMYLWNFIVMNQVRITKLKQQNVDTGMGFERMCKVLQNKETIYESWFISD
jgi:alanyl-tRNA synthetase